MTTDDMNRIKNILLADDDPLACRVTADTLRKWGYVVDVCSDGVQALEFLTSISEPTLALLDWMMPGKTGVDVCREIRAIQKSEPLYLILLPARDNSDDIVTGLEAGADDYITKPFDQKELKARVDVGLRVLALEASLEYRVKVLEAALDQVEQLEGLLPICLYCKKIRSDTDYWQQVDHYLTERSHIKFSHGICPDCYEKVIKEQLGDDE